MHQKNGHHSEDGNQRSTAVNRQMRRNGPASPLTQRREQPIDSGADPFDNDGTRCLHRGGETQTIQLY